MGCPSDSVWAKRPVAHGKLHSNNAINQFDFIVACREDACVFKAPANCPNYGNTMTTRRTFLADVGRAGGFGATYLLMQSLGLLPILASEASVLRLPGTIGKGKKVVILGGGIAGLVSAWELSKA